MKQTMTYFVGRVAPLVAMLALAACDNATVADTLSLNREAPDEFTVVSRPPLTVPPEFTLRPPRAGEAPRGATSDAQARGLLIGQEAKPKETIETIVEPSLPTAVTPVVTSEAPSGAAETFLKRAGAANASDTIRTQLGTDATTPADTSKAKSLMEKLSTKEKAEPVVDAKKEAERLRDNKDKGKPATEGEVPLEKPATPTLLDRLF